MNIIAKKAVKGIPMSSAASVALRCATVLTVATSIPDITALSMNSIQLFSRQRRQHFLDDTKLFGDVT